MNSSDSAPPGVSGAVKAFLLLVLLFGIFLMFASSSLANVNLTSNTPGEAVAAPVVPVSGSLANDFPTAAPAPAYSAAPQVITIPDNTVNPQSPASGTCTNPYTVQSGDTLSGIATLCNTTIVSIRQANPNIANANLIYPGEQLIIPGAASAGPIPNTAGDSGFSQGLSNAQAPTAIPLENNGTPVIPVNGVYPTIRAGAGVQVKALYFPPNAPVNIGIGPLNGTYSVVGTGTTDANGILVTRVTIPTAVDSQTPYAVVVATSANPIAQARSSPFYIAAP